ncbi:MAG: argininosuccinate synthase [Bacilli bacterium]
MKKYNKIILSYSGGLDTSIMIPWLKENYGGCEVVCVTGNVGQGDSELVGLEEKALKSGASKLHILDLREELVNDYIVPAIKAGAVYEKVYLLGTTFSRPLIAKKLVEIAEAEGADAICHGCTGKGNDQVRFELGIKAFNPDIDIIAPWRIWNIKSRGQALDYAEAHGIKLNTSREESYSKDKNLWHLSHEGLDLEDHKNTPDYDKILEMGVTPEKAPDEPTYITLGFEKGIPCSLDDKKLTPLEIIYQLNEIGGKNGIGIIDMVENRLVGMKSRGVYETPGGSIIYKAHDVLETLCLDKDTFRYKQRIGIKFAELLYEAKWYSPLRLSLQAFIDTASEHVTGEVKLKLYKGNIIVQSITSPTSLYSEKTASFDEDEDYNQADAGGFINLYGLSMQNGIGNYLD